jgi:hypothetical protein
MASYIARRKFLATLLGGAADISARAADGMPLVRRINDTAMNLSAVRVNAGRRRFHGR